MTPNAVAYTGAPGHVESWFLRANHPTRPLALWVKVTILAPLQGPPVAETWLVLFDGEGAAGPTAGSPGRVHAHRDTWPMTGDAGPAAALLAALPGETLRVGPYDLDLGAPGHARGTSGGASFDLAWGEPPSAAGGSPWRALGKPRAATGGARVGPGGSELLRIYPWEWLVRGPFPKSKLLTPHPWLTLSGTVTWPGGARWDLDGWDGMQGHNWGKEHAWEYAWGHCVFPGAEPTLVEGFTGRIKLGGALTPRMSALVVRRGGREYRFDRLFDPWRQEATLTARRWTVRLRGPDGEARLRMDAGGRPMACLGYPNPDGRLSYCFNSKLADTLLEVRPRSGAPFTCTSAHGGALEFLRHEPEPDLPVV